MDSEIFPRISLELLLEIQFAAGSDVAMGLFFRKSTANNIDELAHGSSFVEVTKIGRILPFILFSSVLLATSIAAIIGILVHSVNV